MGKRFVLEIDCGGMADPHAEVGLLLLSVVRRVENGKNRRAIYNSNDEEIGRFAFEEAEG